MTIGPTTDALILFSHGSTLCGAGEALAGHAESIRNRGGYLTVEVGYMNYSVPSFAEAVARCAAAGAHRVIVAPYFLVPGKFVKVDLPDHLETARAEWPGLEFVQAEPIGFEERLVDALLELANEARGPEHWRDDLESATLECEPDPVCPLFGTAACPKVPVRPT